MILTQRPFQPADSGLFDALAPLGEPRHDATVMLADGDPVAVADFAEVARGRFCRLGRVVVLPALRHRGVGRALVAAMAEAAFARHAARDLRAACPGADTAGLLFLASLGFVPDGIEAASGADGASVALIHLVRRRAEPSLSDLLFDGMEDGEVVPFRR